MTKKRLWVVPLAALIIVSLLILAGFAVHRISWSQGYRMGQLAAGGESGAVAPYAHFGYPGLFFTIGLLFLLLIVIGKVFRFWAWSMVGGPWMMAGGPMRQHWARHWHGPMPPWYWGWDKPSEEKAEQVGPDAETAAAEA
jgi:hypothetical protein